MLYSGAIHSTISACVAQPLPLVWSGVSIGSRANCMLSPSMPFLLCLTILLSLHHLSAPWGTGVMLGAGSFGKVYKGKWKNKTVAVKVIQHDSGVGDKVGNEVTLMLSFRHRNVVQALYYVMWTRAQVMQAQNDPEVSVSIKHLILCWDGTY